MCVESLYDWCFATDFRDVFFQVLFYLFLGAHDLGVHAVLIA